VVFTVSRGVSLGRRAALATVAGNTAGLALQLVLVVLGLGAVLARSDVIYRTLELIGAAYLMFLGFRTIRERGRLSAEIVSTSAEPRSLATTVLEGMTVGFTNPKGLIIFTAIVPDFIDRSQGHTSLQLLSLGLIVVLVALLSDSSWAMASGSARKWLGRSPRRLERMGTAGGVSMIGLGVFLALTGRRR
jgi:threonine/homoserine/homoserine lactone efflux protein